MRAIHLVAVGATSAGPETAVPALLLDELSVVLARTFQVSCQAHPDVLDAGFAFDPARNQYHSTAILQRLAALAEPQDILLLGVTALDLYVPVLTFVFGEAQVAGRCALASYHRLREEFYGLPPSNDLLHERLAKEAVHELGHAFGLLHCDNWECVMASTHAVERLDLKTARFCPACQKAVLEVAPLPA